MQPSPLPETRAETSAFGGIVSELAAHAGGRDLFRQIHHLFAALRADSEAIHAIEREGELKAFVSLMAKRSGTQNLHADYALARGFHLAQHRDHGFRIGVHAH